MPTKLFSSIPERSFSETWKQASNTLVQRGKEWHRADTMTINAQHVIFVEPVTTGSTVANLIDQAKQGNMRSDLRQTL